MKFPKEILQDLAWKFPNDTFNTIQYNYKGGESSSISKWFDQIKTEHPTLEDTKTLTFEVVENKLVSHSRWSLHYDLVFYFVELNRYYMTSYSKGATEIQDESPFEWADDLHECSEVYKTQTMIDTYVTLKD